MGWFGFEIMAGDPPMDIQDDLYDLAEIEQFPDSKTENIIPKIWFKNNLESILNIQEYKNDELFLPVLGVMMMKSGAEISSSLKKLMIEAAKNDSWSQEEKGRKLVMDQFINNIESYNNDIFNTECEGLMNKIFKNL